MLDNFGDRVEKPGVLTILARIAFSDRWAKSSFQVGLDSLGRDGYVPFGVKVNSAEASLSEDGNVGVGGDLGQGSCPGTSFGVLN